jgi:hypothetical protein
MQRGHYTDRRYLSDKVMNLHIALPSASIRSEQNTALRTGDKYRHVVKQWAVTWVRK